MDYYSTIEDFLEDVKESLYFLEEHTKWEEYEGNRYPYVIAPWTTERIAILLNDAADNIVTQYWIEHGKEIDYKDILKLAYLTPYIKNNYYSGGVKSKSNIYIHNCICYAPIINLNRMLEDNIDIPELNEILSIFSRQEIFDVIQWITAYIAHKYYLLGQYEMAVDFVAAAQLASVLPSSNMEEVDNLDEIIRYAEMEKRRRAAEGGAKKRIEARFKEEIFMPSWQEWKRGEIEYKNQAAFLSEMTRQAMQYLKDNAASKVTISHRTFQYWLADM